MVQPLLYPHLVEPIEQAEARAERPHEDPRQAAGGSSTMGSRRSRRRAGWSELKQVHNSQALDLDALGAEVPVLPNVVVNWLDTLASEATRRSYRRDLI